MVSSKREDKEATKCDWFIYFKVDQNEWYTSRYWSNTKWWVHLMMILLLKKKTKYVVESNNIGLGLGDLKDIMDKNTKRS